MEVATAAASVARAGVPAEPFAATAELRAHAADAAAALLAAGDSGCAQPSRENAAVAASVARVVAPAGPVAADPAAATAEVRLAFAVTEDAVLGAPLAAGVGGSARLASLEPAAAVARPPFATGE